MFKKVFRNKAKKLLYYMKKKITPSTLFFKPCNMVRDACQRLCKYLCKNFLGQDDLFN